MFQTAWLGLPWLPYEQGRAMLAYTRRNKEKRRPGLGCVKKDSALGKDGLGSGDRTVYLL